MTEPVIKIRYTTRDGTWTMPTGDDPRVDDCLFGEPWTELHVVHIESKQLLARYSRGEAISMYAICKDQRRTRNGQRVKVMKIKLEKVNVNS